MLGLHATCTVHANLRPDIRVARAVDCDAIEFQAPSRSFRDSTLSSRGLQDEAGTCRQTTVRHDGLLEGGIPDHGRQRLALKTSMRPEDAANAVRFPRSGKEAKLTGTILTVDGALLLCDSRRIGKGFAP